ncbi:DUF4157 domain-containing protein [Streptomyces sp. NPDC059556]|uniref:eCIS core domain-containing protein n=1 Tax=Streptomyces sp. NPDC059556 TaxID=3346863 RepID=UPI00368F325E
MGRAGLPELQRSAGNAAVLRMLQRAGHPFAQPPATEQHQHGAGCGHAQAAPPAVQRSAVHDVLSGSGRPLDAPVRQEMESRLGADFSDVRIHRDGAARASAAEVGARAYTSGDHIVIGEGGNDKHTLAHELTHVIQQRQGPVAGTDNGAGLKVSDPSDRFEREAEANAVRVMNGPADGARSAPEVQRAPAGRTAREAGGGTLASASVQRMAGGGHAQGDHVFNALGATAIRVAEAIQASMKAYLSTVDSGIVDIAKAAKGNPGEPGHRAAGPLFQNRANRTGNVGVRLRALRDAATAAEALGHPSDTGAAHYSFIATLPTTGGQAADENSTTYGTFSAELVGLASRVGTVTPLYEDSAGEWAIPGEYRSGAGSWSGFLRSKIYDGDACERVRTQRVGNRTAAFNTWLADSQAAYATLYTRIIEALDEARSLVLWYDGMQRRTYSSEVQEFEEYAGATPEALAAP